MDFRQLLRGHWGLRILVSGLITAIFVLGACQPISAPPNDAERADESELERSATPVAEEDVAENGPETVETDQNGEITLTPYTDPLFNIDSVVPEGWVPVDNGVYIRQQTEDDITVLAQQAVQLDAETLLMALMPQFGLSEAPASVGTHQGAVLEWTLYRLDIDADGLQFAIDLALAEAEGFSYMLLLQTTPAESETLYEQVFLPTMDVLQPLSTQAVDTGPLPYDADDVAFENDDITLAGTLTLPPSPGPHPAVILVSGSGPQDRDLTLGPNIPIRPFALLADGLTQAGIAVLRYDDRGVAQSTGDFSTASIPDFAADTEAAIRYLQSRPEIDSEQIGLLGHSEGGMIAAMLGADSEDVAFLVTLAGPGVSGLDVLLLQNRLIFEAEGAAPEEIERQLAFVEAIADPEILGDAEAIEALAYPHILWQLERLPPEQLAQLGDLELFAAENARQLAQDYSAGWFQSFVEYDPADDWSRTTIPVLAIYGELDMQVDAEQNAPAVRAALEAADNEHFEVVRLGDANHLFQAAETGALTEYAILGAQFTPELMPLLISWLQRYVEIDEALDEAVDEALNGAEDQSDGLDSENSDNELTDAEAAEEEVVEEEVEDGE